MSIIAKRESDEDFTPVPAGTHQAVCYDLWDIGFQEGEWEGKKIIQPKIIIAWEINKLIPEGKYAGKRMTINKFYTLSLGKKATLLKHLEGWRGRKFTKNELEGFDVERVVGSNCMLSVVLNEKEKEIVGGISQLMEGMTPISPENKRSTPEWIEKFRAKQVEDPTANEPDNVALPDSEDIPF